MRASTFLKDSNRAWSALSASTRHWTRHDFHDWFLERFSGPAIPKRALSDFFG